MITLKMTHAQAAEMARQVKNPLDVAEFLCQTRGGFSRTEFVRECALLGIAYQDTRDGFAEIVETLKQAGTIQPVPTKHSTRRIVWVSNV